MSYLLRLNSVLLGTSPLADLDRCGGIAYGPFAPTEAYDLVRPVFRLFAAANRLPEGAARTEARARYYAARDALGLTLTTESGDTVETRWVHIRDLADGDATDLELQAALVPPGKKQR
jgi:hypothetical protein